MFKHKPSFVVEWRYFPLLKDSLPKRYLSRSQMVMWGLRGSHPKPAPDQHRDCTVVIKTYCVYHIELHEQRYYFHNDVVLNKKGYVISDKSSNMPISSLFKRCYIFLNLTQIHGIFRRHIILNVAWLFWVRYTGPEKLRSVESRLHWLLVLNTYTIIACIYNWIIEANKPYAIKKKPWVLPLARFIFHRKDWPTSSTANWTRVPFPLSA